MIHVLSSLGCWVCRSHVCKRSNAISKTYWKTAASPPLPATTFKQKFLCFSTGVPLGLYKSTLSGSLPLKLRIRGDATLAFLTPISFFLHRSQMIFFHISAQRARETAVQSSRIAGVDMQVPFWLASNHYHNKFLCCEWEAATWRLWDGDN